MLGEKQLYGWSGSGFRDKVVVEVGI